MAVWAGAGLSRKEGHAGSRHKLVVATRQNEWSTHVNSYHNWGLVSCPDLFEVAARAEDGAIEAIKHINLPWEGWMWHPERETLFSPQDTARINQLFR
jgi:gamma-glutamyl-gamma-aminobutyrate hydrolase PuuD